MSAQVRTLLAGLLIAVSIAVLTLTGGVLGITEPWPVLLVAGSGLLVGVPRLRHALALVSGIAIGALTAWTSVAVLPDAPIGRAIAASAAVLLITVLTLASRGRLRFGMQLVGWAAMTALARMPSAGIALAPRAGDLARIAVVLLVASGVGLLVAQVAQLVGTGIVRVRGDVAAAFLALCVGLIPLVAAPTPAMAEHAVEHPGRRVIEHRQTIVRTHAPDGTVTGGDVVTRLSVGRSTSATNGAGMNGAGTNGADRGVTVVLRDQAVRDLRSLTTLARRGAPTVSGSTVTHLLSGRTVGPDASVRTIAALERPIPIGIEVAITLDGEPVTPAGAVGRSGRLEVTYTLVNRTAEPRELRHFDGRGRPRTVTRDVAVPFVGELVVLLDDRFSGVRSDDATVVAVPPRAGARSDVIELRAAVVLAEPLGAPVRTITWRADVEEAIVPPVSVRLAAVPLSDSALGAADEDRAERVTRALRDVADAVGLARTGLIALEATDAGAVLAGTAAAVDSALAAAAAAGGEVNELRALVAAQDRRAVGGDGLVHGLLLAADVDADEDVTVRTSAVYVLELAGRDADDAVGLLARLALALLLVIAVGLLGRSIGTLTGTAST
jgi:hypothetical protein